MSFRGLKLTHLAFVSPRRPYVEVPLKHGVNAVCGASDTGKSFVADSFDFMLGGSVGLRDIPERAGYDQVLLGVETSAGGLFTLSRSIDGGGFRLHEGSVRSAPDSDDGEVLKPKHSAKSQNNVSRWLLGAIGLDEKKVRKNKKGETRTLSFRDLARLVVVNETEITKKESPVYSGQPIQKTAEHSTLRLLLSGTDDSSLVYEPEDLVQVHRDEGRLEVIDRLLVEYDQELHELSEEPEEIASQLERVQATLEEKRERMRSEKAQLGEVASQRRSHWQRRTRVTQRIDEIDELLARFHLLDSHYQSDLRRLEMVHESGALLAHFDATQCPVCGAEPDEQHRESDCVANVEQTVEAASAEISKIGTLKAELADTLAELEDEREQLRTEDAQLSATIIDQTQTIDERLTPLVAEAEEAYELIVAKQTELQSAMRLHNRFVELQAEKLRIETEHESPGAGVDETPDGAISKRTLDELSTLVEEILRAWNHPRPDRVYFDAETSDFVISGQPRGSTGKGLRAITHAAFSIGLLQFCRQRDLPHPGFVVLDSPLLAYREPEGDEDDLRGADVKERFFEYLSSLPEDVQVIVLENEHPPPGYEERANVVVFTRNPNQGRYGLFPV